jgi:chromosome segregation ATPase
MKPQDTSLSEQESALVSQQTVEIKTLQDENIILSETLASCKLRYDALSEELASLQSTSTSSTQEALLKTSSLETTLKKLEMEVVTLKQELTTCQQEKHSMTEKLSNLEATGSGTSPAVMELRAQNQK